MQEIGLLRPAWTDPSSGYRWYEPEQLGRLHRIVALRDLGVRLVEVARILDEPVSVEALRGILVLRRAEAQDRLAAEEPSDRRLATLVLFPAAH